MVIAQKTSQVALHMSVAFLVTFVCTGSMAVGGLAAIVEPVCNVLLLPLHDRAWAGARKNWNARKEVALSVLANVAQTH